MKHELIIFDMDGTLVNSSITIANAINYVRKNLGFEPMAYDEIIKKVNDHTINPAQVFYYAKSFDRQHEQWFSEYYTKNHRQELQLYEGIGTLLEKLKQRGHKLAVATNAYRGSAIESLTHLEIYEHFDVIACYDDVTRGKPYPDMLYKVLKDVEVDVDKALFIGDGPRDELASKRAGIPYLMVDWGFSEHSNAILTVSELEAILLG
ncbi:MAG: HAD family hydrolase [Campylobacterales bacterium]|nr:HAD family hydrolase [Campylobacterales bacterium]